ncbi:MAG TPA: hypothetical protein VMV71_03260, partial [Candidatus Paceibacterota bacterium]|nr:hypothetical protein [Candidatus Paceibacterota bacterium]
MAKTFELLRHRKIAVLPFLSLCAFKASAVFAAATGQIDLTNITQTQVTGDAGQNLANWIQSFYTFSLVGGVFLAVGVIVWAGLK